MGAEPSQELESKLRGLSVYAHAPEEEHTISSERNLPAESLPAHSHSHSRYPLNSRRLTSWHLWTLAKALGLPTSGSQDQLRQCAEGVVQRGHYYENVMVVVRESLKMEYIVVLEDLEGEFLQSDLVYRKAPQRMRGEDVQLVERRHPTREPPASGYSDAVVPSPGHVLPEVGSTPATLADDPMRPGAGPASSTPSSHHESGPLTHTPDGRRRQDKALPIEFFSGEDPAILLDDWLPSLERASSWNGWSTEDQLMQLPGYLRGRAGGCSQALSRSPTQSPLRHYICGSIRGARRSLPRSFVIHSSEVVRVFQISSGVSRRPSGLRTVEMT